MSRRRSSCRSLSPPGSLSMIRDLGAFLCSPRARSRSGAVPQRASSRAKRKAASSLERDWRFKSLRRRVVGGVDPVGFLGGKGGLRDHLQVALADGFADGVGGGVDGDLKLLVPQLRLALLDLRVKTVGLEVQFQ